MMLTPVFLAALTFATLTTDHPVCVAAVSDARLTTIGPKKARRKMNNCNRLAKEATRRNVDPALVIEIGWRETRWEWVDTHKVTGCSGPLQASPKHWCPGGRRQGCNLLNAGFKALTTYMKQSDTLELALCRFNGGWRCNARARRGARAIIRRVNRIHHLLGV